MNNPYKFPPYLIKSNIEKLLEQSPIDNLVKLICGSETHVFLSYPIGNNQKYQISAGSANISPIIFCFNHGISIVTISLFKYGKIKLFLPSIYDCISDRLSLKLSWNLSNNILLLFSIKYKCNPSRQTPSWATSILNRNIDISSKKYDKYNNSINIDRLYNIALRKAKKDNKVPKEFDTRPEEWTLDNLKDSEYVNNFLKDNYGTNQYTFDIDEKISSKKKKK